MEQLRGISLGGILTAVSQREVEAEQRRRAELAQQSPVVMGLAAHVKACWVTARQAKEQTVEQRMFKSVRARRCEYEPDMLAKIRQQGGSEIYMALTSVKCRAAASWLRDVLLGQGQEKPWTLKATPVPTLPPTMVEQIRREATERIANMIQTTQTILPPDEVREMLMAMKESTLQKLRDEASAKVSRMEAKMEDQLAEGGYATALDQFIDDLTTFPAAVMKGPVVRNKPRLGWVPVGAGQFEIEVRNELVLEWERVDPFMLYPSPSSTGVDDGYLIERHKLRQVQLEEMLGVEGYDDDAIRAVLDTYGRGGLQEWLMVDSSKADVEGRSTTAVMQNADRLIDALQFWGHVPGTMLREWGLSDEEVPDPAKQYHCECWLIGSWVIKATINADPLGRKPYYKASYEEIPGAFWGNSVADLIRDCQDMCNSAARALANNMGVASGPQVWVNVDRVAEGEDITNIYPWKVWQVTSDQMGSTADPVKFFQPTSNVAELLAVFDKFTLLAEEYSGVPRYMTGDSNVGGAGRTASGMSMLMGNANKAIKQVVSNIDYNVTQPLLERQYYYNMRYSEDPELKGDVNIIARGANSLVAKEAAQVRRNEFLAATNNPVDMQIVGIEGRANLLREAAKALEMDPDKIVPSTAKLKLQQIMTQQMAQAQQAAQMGAGGPPPRGMPGNPAANPINNQQTLANSAPITDNFAPTAQ